METVPVTHHLVRRKGVFYYRRRVPADVAGAIGRKAILLSLKTGDLKQAVKQREILDLRWSAQFERARQQARPTNLKAEAHPAFELGRAQINEIIRDYVERVSARDIARLVEDGPVDRSEKREIISNIEEDLQILTDPGDTRSDQSVYAIGAKALEQAGGSIEALSVPYPQFAELMRRALVEIDRRKLAHLNDDHGAEFFDTLFAIGRKPSITFGALAKQFLTLQEEDATANNLSQKSIDRLQSQVALIRDLVGHDTPVSSLTYDACLRVRSLLAQVPRDRTKHYGDLPIDRAIALARDDGRPLLAGITQQQYLGVFREMLDLAARKQLIPLNFAAEIAPVKRDDVSRQHKRRAFTDEQLKHFFESPFYRRCARDNNAPYAADMTGWRFWMPLLTLFMGLRPKETCQLDVADIKQSPGGTRYVDVATTEDDDGSNDSLAQKKTLKNRFSQRRVPLHPELVRIGFVEFAERQRGLGEKKLFPALKPDRYGNPASYALKRFRDRFLSEAISLDERQSFYSFRHCFRDALRRAQANHDALRALGWSQGNLVSDHYGDGLSPDDLAEVIGRVAFPGLDLAHLHVKA